MGSAEMHPIPPPEEEALVPEELETEGSQKQEEELEEEELGILQYLDQLEQVTARFLCRLVLFIKYIYCLLYVRSALCPNCF